MKTFKEKGLVLSTIALAMVLGSQAFGEELDEIDAIKKAIVKAEEDTVSNQPDAIPPSTVSTTYSPYGPGTTKGIITLWCVDDKGKIVPNCNTSVNWYTIGGSGGHSHTGSRPPGVITMDNGATGGSLKATSKTSPYLYVNTGPTGVMQGVWEAPEAAGITTIRSGRTLTARVAYQPDGGMFRPSHSLLYVDPAADNHGSNDGYADAPMRSALLSMMDSYSSCEVPEEVATVTPPQRVTVTALSLPQGGIFDFRGEFWGGYQGWTGSHKTHRWGREVDMAHRSLSAYNQTCLALAASRSGLTFPVQKESPTSSTATHWHISYPPHDPNANG